MEKTIAEKRLRNRVRLELAILGDRVLNELTEELRVEMNRRVAAGEPFALNHYEEWVVAEIDTRIVELRQLSAVS